MHNLYFVLIDKDEASDSKEAQEMTYSELENNGFVFHEGYFGGGRCDWFVIGGRWSGVLTHEGELPKRNTGGGYDYPDDAMLLSKELLERLNQSFADVHCFIPSESDEIMIKDLKEGSINDYWIVVVDYHY